MSKCSNKNDNLEEVEDGIAFNSPNAFKDSEEEDTVMKKNTISFEEAFNRINNLLEISYNEFKADPNTVKAKLNKNIAEVSKSLRQVETLLNHALKLKAETGADQTYFYKKTFSKFTKIGEQLNKLQTKIREFSK